MYSIEINSSDLTTFKQWANHNYMFQGVEFTLDYTSNNSVTVMFKYPDHYQRYCSRFQKDH